MPQKQNPVACAAVLAAAARVPALVSILLAAMPQENERGLGGWHAEWETLPEIFELTAGALAQLRHIIANLSVHSKQMRANCDAAGGLLYAATIVLALSPKIGREAAHALVERSCRRAVETNRGLRHVLVDDPEITGILSVVEIEQLFDCQPHIAAAERLVDQSLAAQAPLISPGPQQDDSA
jgi:3-carboxy-cis,cis-muconate cycloisomerase